MPELSLDLAELTATPLGVPPAPVLTLDDIAVDGHLMTEVGASALGREILLCSCCCCC